VHVKAHSKEGSKKKYDAHIRAIAPTQIFEEKNASDWDIARTMHKAFESIQHQIEHRLKISSKGLKAHQTENRRNK